jgi:hypothetical protein
MKLSPDRIHRLCCAYPQRLPLKGTAPSGRLRGGEIGNLALKRQANQISPFQGMTFANRTHDRGHREDVASAPGAVG